MSFENIFAARAGKWIIAGVLALAWDLRAQVPVVVETNAIVRIAAANLSSGTSQRYEAPGLRILKGLQPDIVAIQEFNYASTTGAGINTPAALREMIDATFGTNFVFFRESYSGIPNGVISRYPMLASGSWDDGDDNINDRGFAWARIDVPGTNDLYVVSAHLKASTGSDNALRRAAQVSVLKSLIDANFPANAWVVVAGDMNLFSETEPAITTLRTFVSDSPVPADQNGGINTNAGRTQRYDRVLPSFSLTNILVPVTMPSHTFLNGLVFDSRVYTPLSDVAPVLAGDSGVPGMQHMAVVKDFQITYTITNHVTPPALTLEPSGVIRWLGASNVVYTVQTSTNLSGSNWTTLGTASSSSTNISFTNHIDGAPEKFFRVMLP